MYHFWSHHQRSLKTTSIRHLKGLELRNGRHIFLVDSLHSSMSRGMKRGPTFQKTYVKLHNPCAYFIWESRKHRFFSALVLFYKRTRFWLQFSILHTFLPQKIVSLGLQSDWKLRRSLECTSAAKLKFPHTYAATQRKEPSNTFLHPSHKKIYEKVFHWHIKAGKRYDDKNAPDLLNDTFSLTAWENHSILEHDETYV